MAGVASYGELMVAQSFGRQLRLRRERLGISLETIAASTKINRSLLADLERDDVSKWPGGIYRRAFVREYAAAIGLSADAVLAEFLELFPEEGKAPSGRPTPAGESPGELRLTLAEDRTQALIGTARRLVVVLMELGAVLSLGWLIALATAANFWAACGAIALTYYPIASACSTRVPVLGWPAVKSLFTVSARGDDARSSGDLIQLVLRRPPVQSADERTA